MLCAHTVRRLKPGTFEQFRQTFRPPDEATSAGWVRFHMLRSLRNEDEVVTFGFFDGTLEELEASQRRQGYEERRDAVSAYVEQTVLNGIYEIVEAWSPGDAPAG